jgi:ABC transport system ATP-binding/permease protein
MFILSAIQTLTFVWVGNSVLGIHNMYSDYWMVLFSVSCFANILGLNISSAFNSAVTIYILIPFLIIPQLLLAGVVVKFDKLNPTLSRQGSVPLSGEVMASRWAFEALAVNQFKENAFEKNFYKFDKTISVAQYKKDYWMPKLEDKLNKIDKELTAGKTLRDVKDDIQLLYNELSKESNQNRKIKCTVLDKINVASYDNSVKSEIKNYLGNLRESFISMQNNARKKQDEVSVRMQKTEEDKARFIKLKADCDNENLNNLVKNASELYRCIEKDGRLIQQIDPIFQDPTESNFGRAHFFAPRKKFMGAFFSTYWFNISIIWLMSVLLIVTLYFETFKWVLDGFEKTYAYLKNKRVKNKKA